MTLSQPDPDGLVAVRLSVRGVVQGVGFRPFVYSLAQRHAVTGWVRNTSAGVEILAEGTPAAVEAFVLALPREAPPRSHIAACERAGAAPEGAAAFLILDSAVDPDAYQLVSPDIATCDDCRARASRRARPAVPLSLHQLHQLRPALHDHRGSALRPGAHHHAALPAVPGLPARNTKTRPTGAFTPSPTPARCAGRGCGWCGARTAAAIVELAEGTPHDPAAPIRAAAELLRRGEILAVKGLGGFHLACDATDGEAVRRLKQRKRRPHKALAVMFADLEQLRAHCRVSPEEEELLASPEHPIVLLPWREVAANGAVGAEVGERAGTWAEPAGGADPVAITPEVATGQRYLGAMLPYTPLHHPAAARRPGGRWS